MAAFEQRQKERIQGYLVLVILVPVANLQSLNSLTTIEDSSDFDDD